MEIQTYSAAGSVSTLAGRNQVGKTTVHTVKKQGQSYSVYGKNEGTTKVELSPKVQMMLDDKMNPDLQDFARRMYLKHTA